MGTTFNASGGTQSAAGTGLANGTGTFGVGGSANASQPYGANVVRGGGGGGWFGGGASHLIGAGGSGYIKTTTSIRPSGYAWPAGNNTFAMTNTQMIAGNASMPNHNANANMTGNAGHGVAIIMCIQT